MRKFPSESELAQGILSRDRASLAQAISLVESSKKDHKSQAQYLIAQLLPYTGKSRRIGITGTPGAGKSSFIEAFGMQGLSQGRSIAVLAVDPSSTKTKGSILGDKTRMEQLSQSKEAFIRPSPSKGYYGGVALSTYESILLCEAFGFEDILIETVGVGQSETMVADMVDMFLLVALAGGGDELQGIKRGIMEMADMVFINKVDQEPGQKEIAFYTDLKRALTFFSEHERGWKTPIIMGSATEQKGIDKVWNETDKYFEKMQQNGYLEQKRRAQNVFRFRNLLEQNVLDSFWAQQGSKTEAKNILKEVEEGRLFPLEAVDRLFKTWDGNL